MPFLRATPASKKGLVNYWGLKFCQRNSNWERAGLSKARVRHAILVKTASYRRIGQSPYPSGSTRILVLWRTWLGTLFVASKLFLHLKALLWWTKPFLGLTSWHTPYALGDASSLCHIGLGSACSFPYACKLSWTYENANCLLSVSYINSKQSVDKTNLFSVIWSLHKCLCCIIQKKGIKFGMQG